MVDKRKIGKRLRKLRNELHLSSRHAAEQLDISHVYLCEIERGDKTGSPATLKKLAQFYGITLDELLDD